MGAVVALEWAPSSAQTLYALTDKGDLYQTTDGATTWNLRESRRFSAVITGLAVDPSDAETAVAVASPNGKWGFTVLLRTHDGGRTWAPLGYSISIRALKFDPVHPELLYGYGSGIESSVDGGEHWSPVGLESLYVFALAIDPYDGLTLLASAESTQPSFAPVVLWRSHDQGLHWRPTSLSVQVPGDYPPVFYPVFDISRRGWAYAFQTADFTSYLPSTGPVYRSQDGGRSWVLLPAATGVVDLAVASDGRLYAATGSLGVSRSDDAGETWTPPFSTESAPPDEIRKVVVSVGSCESVFASGHLGVWESADRGQRWDFASLGIASEDVTSILTAVGEPPTVLALASPEDYYFDNADAIFSGHNRGQDWDVLYTAYDAAATYRLLAVDPRNPSTVFGVGSPGACDTLTKSTDGGRSWQTAFSNCYADSSAYNAIFSFAVGPLSPRAILVSGLTTDGVLDVFQPYTARSNDGGATWTFLSPPAAALAPLVFSPTQPSLLYGMTCDQLFASRDDGNSWYPLAGGLPCGSDLPILVIDPQSPRSLYLGTDAGVFHSPDGGASFHRLGHRLESAHIAALVIDPTNSANLYAGVTGQGVWRWDPSLEDWTSLSFGLPSGSFSGALAIDPQNPSTLYAGTIGRGLFRLLLPDRP
jgi:photosystem II stability/assembly factor-like uncharacterized protein